MVKVKELIEILKALEDQEAPVYFHNGLEYQLVKKVEYDNFGNVDIK